MMKKIILSALLIIFIQGVYSQNKTVGLEGKRFNLEAGVGVSLFPSYIFFNDDLYTRNKLTDLISTRYNVELGYSLTNKIKASFHYSMTSLNIDSINTYDQDEHYYVNNYTAFYAYNSFLDTRVKSYGLKVNYFLHDFISPVGGSIGLSFKKTFINTKNHIFTSIDIVEDNWGYESLLIVTDTSELKMNYTTIGFHYENMVFVSSKIPLYFKYGISTALRVGKKATKGGEEIVLSKTVDGYGDELKNIHRQFLARSYRHDIFEFNFGLGIIF